MYLLRFITLIIMVLSAYSAMANEPFVIAGEAIESGTRSDLRLNVAAHGNEPATFIPLTIINGTKEGPVLATVSGVHGNERLRFLSSTGFT